MERNIPAPPRIEIVRWIAECKHPFAIVKDRGFVGLMKTGRPMYRLPSPATVARDVKQVFVSMRSQLATKLKVLTCIVRAIKQVLKWQGTRWLPELRDRRVDLPKWAGICRCHCTLRDERNPDDFAT